MCDYCDCRSHPQIAALSRDHELLLHLLRELTAALAADDGERAAQVTSQLHEVLHAHGAREERGVFTQLRRVVADDGYVPMFERDHEELHRLLDPGDGPTWQHRATQIVELLADHILREETDLFPAAHQMLEPAQWSAIDDILPTTS